MRLLCTVTLLAFFLGACSLDYRPAQLEDDRAETVPETVLIEAQLVIVRSEARRFRVSAQRVEHFPEQQQQVFSRFAFEEIDRNGAVLSSGSAESAIYFTDSDDIEMSGNISFYSYQHQAGIHADWLRWNDEQRRLAGSPDGLVRVERDGGSTISGVGFAADMRSSTVEFAEQVSGTLVTDEN